MENVCLNPRLQQALFRLYRARTPLLHLLTCNGQFALTNNMSATPIKGLHVINRLFSNVFLADHDFYIEHLCHSAYF